MKIRFARLITGIDAVAGQVPDITDDACRSFGKLQKRIPLPVEPLMNFIRPAISTHVHWGWSLLHAFDAEVSAQNAACDRLLVSLRDLEQTCRNRDDLREFARKVHELHDDVFNVCNAWTNRTAKDCIWMLRAATAAYATEAVCFDCNRNN